jgi:hypothetical protein
VGSVTDTGTCHGRRPDREADRAAGPVGVPIRRCPWRRRLLTARRRGDDHRHAAGRARGDGRRTRRPACRGPHGPRHRRSPSGRSGCLVREHPPERLVGALQWSQFWTRHGGDEILVEHDTVRLAPLRGDTSITPEQASAAEDAAGSCRAGRRAGCECAPLIDVPLWVAAGPRAARPRRRQGPAPGFTLPSRPDFRRVRRRRGIVRLPAQAFARLPDPAGHLGRVARHLDDHGHAAASPKSFGHRFAIVCLTRPQSQRNCGGILGNTATQDALAIRLQIGHIRLGRAGG